MKKIIIAAAIAVMSAVGFGGNCGEVEDSTCALTMTVKFNGKTACEKGTAYKTTQTISGKGTLSIGNTVTETLTVKVGGEKHDIVLADGEITKFSVFGKNLETATTENTMKPGKAYKVSSDLAVKFEDQSDYGISLMQVAFGDGKIKVSKAKTIKNGPCGEDDEILGCVPTVEVTKFSGWFTGKFYTCLDEEGYTDSCVEFDADGATALCGGTWTAKVVK